MNTLGVPQSYDQPREKDTKEVRTNFKKRGSAI